MVYFPYRNYEEGTESSVTYYQFMDHGDMISCCGLMIHQTYGDEQMGVYFPIGNYHNTLWESQSTNHNQPLLQTFKVIVPQVWETLLTLLGLGPDSYRFPSHTTYFYPLVN